MRPFDSVRAGRALRVAIARSGASVEVTRAVRHRGQRGPVDWDVPTVVRRRLQQNGRPL